MTGSRDGPWPPAGAALAATLLANALLLTSCAGDAPPPAATAEPAQRIVALAPHLAELAYAAGAGPRLAGVVEFSNHPEAARALPRVGDAFRIDLEALAALRPDLVLGWPSGNSPAALDRLRSLGYRVVELEPRRLADVGDQIEAIGRLAGTEPEARQAAAAWRDGLAALQSRYAGSHPGRVFYQIAPQPLITVTREHFIGEAIELCGGENIYADLPGLTAVVSVESVVSAAPDAIVANDFTRGPGSPESGTPLDAWRSWTGLTAVSRNRLHVLDPDLMSVPGPRLLKGITQLCAALN
ncbi:MAG: cobalamin-binding protein, partial [Chromatiales bacterium]|nr:cobalamin-binding protein [Chromatiales bacterium]